VVDDHIASCESCRERLTKLQNVPGKRDSLYAQLTTAKIEHLGYEELESYVNELCGATDREIIESHLQLCDSCLDQVRDLQRLRFDLTRSRSGFWEKFAALWNSREFAAPVKALSIAALFAVFGLVISLIVAQNHARSEKQLAQQHAKDMKELE